MKTRFDKFFERALKALALNTERVLVVLESFEDDAITQQLRDKILRREQFGYKKYGVTMDRKDYTRHDWLLHLLEELIDGAGYAMAAGEYELCENLLSDARHVLKQIDSLIK